MTVRNNAFRNSRLTLNAVKEQQKQIEEMNLKIDNLQLQNPIENQSFFSFSQVIEEFKNLGIWIENGITKVQKLVAQFIETKELKLGSPEAPTGFTIYDRTTKEPYCIFIDNGEIVKTKGECLEGETPLAPLGEGKTTPHSPS